MGFDFHIGNEHMYFSYNWGNLSEKTGWYIRDDVFDKTGREVAKGIAKTLTRLEKEGYTVGTPDENNVNWGWGCTQNGKELDDNERIPIFMYLIREIGITALSYPDYVVIDEDNDENKYIDEDYEKVEWNYEEDVDPEFNEFIEKARIISGNEYIKEKLDWMSTGCFAKDVYIKEIKEIVKVINTNNLIPENLDKLTSIL